MHTNSSDKTPPEQSPDPIARNPKDGDSWAEGPPVTESRPDREVVLPVPRRALPGLPWDQATHTQAAHSPADFLVGILRFKWTFLMVFALLAAPVILLVWTQVIPKYQARAEVRVRPIIPRLVFKTDENGAIPFYDSFVNTQVSLIRSLTVLQRVLEQQEIQKTQWYRSPARPLWERLRGSVMPPMERLREGLSVRPRPRTEIIDIAFDDASANDAKLIVDAVLEQYQTYIDEASDETEKTIYGQLTNQRASLAGEIGRLQEALAQEQKSLGTGTPSELISNKRVRLDEIEARLAELRNTIAVLEWEKEQPIAASPSEEPWKHRDDAEWRQLNTAVEGVLREINRSPYLPTHPNMMRMKKDLEYVKELRRQREAQLDEQWRDGPPSGVAPKGVQANGGPGEAGPAPVSYRLTRAQREEQLLQAELKRQQTEFERLFANAQKLENDQSELKHKQELFEAVRQRLDQKNMERDVPGSVAVLAQAFAPSRPAQDRRMVLTVMTVFLAFGAGAGAAFLRARRHGGIYTPRDLPQPIQPGFLGCIPVIPTAQPLGRSLREESRPGHSILIESVRVVRTALLSRLDPNRGTTVLITSAMGRTGKSSFTIALGSSIARSGRKVLIIDADSRKATLSKWFDLLDKPGFKEALGDKTANGQHIFPTKTPGLSVMPAGKRGQAGIMPEETANGAFKRCLDRLLEQYDVILLDSPPILPVADAVILGNQVDGTIMVERERVSRRENVGNALARLSATGGRLLGMVFVSSAEQELYGYGYGPGASETREP